MIAVFSFSVVASQRLSWGLGFHMWSPHCGGREGLRLVDMQAWMPDNEIVLQDDLHMNTHPRWISQT
eukprot:1766090-Amphidinium_carterae.1